MGAIHAAPEASDTRSMRGLVEDSFVTGTVPGSREDWRGAFGAFWKADLGILALILFALGTMIPLRDPDLPMHLAIGEWIIANRTWPLTEPFAWTRAGEPFFAYSHFPEILYYLLLKGVGPIGLRMLNGMLLVCAAASVIYLGGIFRWRPWVTLMLAASNAAIGLLVVPALRPQSILLVAVPLCWAFSWLVLQSRHPAWPTAGLLLASALAANSHLFFPITAASAVLCWVYPPRQRARIALVLGALVAGWLLSPYGLRWHEVFALNFGANALLETPSPIVEFSPGFSRLGVVLLFPAALSLIPWALDRNRLTSRELLGFSCLWLLGLVAFGYAARLLLLWWLIALPVAGLALMHRTGQSASVPPRNKVRIAAWGIALLLLLLPVSEGVAAWRDEGSVIDRRLPSVAQRPTEPLLAWLECHASTGMGGRVFTWFNYGSYLTWRMPRYSMSIDGRTIFPDSVARADVLRSALVRPPEHGPWKSADLAIIPLRFRVAAVLDTATGWRRAAWTHSGPGRAPIGLWIREEWWEAAGTQPLPASADYVIYDESRRRGCAALGLSETAAVRPSD